ncbi:MAG TPA: hypothetical protein P5096_01300 [Patescibacteria group bacterium]|nr:hypothetical protein [Patescibacteria group bacterium]
MIEIEKIVLTSSLTIIGGIVVYVVGLIINEFYIKPYIEYKKAIGEIDEEMMFFSNVYTNPIMPITTPFGNEEVISFYKHASKQLRRVASKFSSVYKAARCKKLFKIINEGDKNKVIGNLISLSNSLFYSVGDRHITTQNHDKAVEIRKILNI